MHILNSFFLAALIVASTGCAEIAVTETPDFVTAVLPSMLPPPATQIATLPVSTLSTVAEPTITPVEGTTTTQINVRAETSTASETLGLIEQFAKIQITGKDASGSWYRIIFTESGAGYGWVRAEYVLASAPEKILLVENAAGSGLGVSGLVIQKINVRNGPGTTFESLGVLNPNDVVFITGRDAGNTWMQIEFKNSPDGKGWAASEFLQTENLDAVPVIGPVETAETPAILASVPAANILTAPKDGDSIEAPSASVNLSTSGSRSLQFSGDVSYPDGDVEDWVQVTSSHKSIHVELKCSNNALSVELWNNAQQAEPVLLFCGGDRTLNLAPGQPYFLRIQANGDPDLQYIQYTLKISTMES